MSSQIFFIVLAALSLVAVSCGKIQVIYNGQDAPKAAPKAKPYTSAEVNGKTISGGMDDEEILAAFDVDINSAEKTTAKGPDGYSNSYTYGDQRVSITRSVVSGASVWANGPINGSWRLGGGFQ